MFYITQNKHKNVIYPSKIICYIKHQYKKYSSKKDGQIFDKCDENNDDMKRKKLPTLNINNFHSMSILYQKYINVFEMK